MCVCVCVRVCVWVGVCVCLCVYIPGGADRGDGGGSQGDAMQSTLLQERCVVIGILRLNTHTHTHTNKIEFREIRGSNIIQEVLHLQYNQNKT